MKKITLLFVFFLAIDFCSYGQGCLLATSTTPLWPTATYTPATCDGTTLNSIATNCYASEYSNVNVILGETYTFTSSVATDFITIGSEDGTTAIVFGENGTLTWIADLTGVVRFYTHLDNACGGANVNRTRGVICGTPPTCPKPLNVLVGNIATITADFTWDAGGSETEWEVIVLPNGDPAPDASTVGVLVSGSSIYQATALNDSSQYQFYVRANCGSGDLSAWTVATNFITACLPIASLPYFEDFETTATGTNVFPTCWGYNNTAGNWLISTTPVANSGANSLRRTWSTDGWAFTPPATLTAGTSYSFSYYVRTNDEVVGYDVTVGVGEGQTDVDMTTTLDAVTGYHNASWSKKSFVFIPPTNGDYSFGIHVVAPLAPNGINFDDFKIDLTPSCVEPTSLVASIVTDASATVTWSESITTPSSGYEYYISEDNSAPEATTTPTGTIGAGVLTYTFTGLTANTTYNVWVRSACSGGTSEWSSMITFKTNCGSLTSFFENFDAALTLPDCWSKVGISGTTNVQTSSVAPSAPNVLYIYGTSAANQPVVAMPAVSNAGSATHQLKFKAKANFTIGGVIEVGYLTNSSDATSFISLQSFTTTSTSVFNSFTANLGTEPGSNQVIAFRHSGVPANSVLIDDVSWQPIPTTAPNCTTANATPHSTCGNSATIITWTPVAGVDGYKLTIGTTVGGSDIMNNESIGDVTAYSYAGSFNSTYYFTVTPFNAFGSATGCAEQSFTTFVDGCYCTSNPTSNDNNGITNVQLGTVDFPNGDVMYADYTSTPVDLGQGLSTNLQVSFATGFTYDTNIWIDFNNDFNFDDSELVKSGTSLATNPTVLDLTFTMPSDAAIGTHRMRLGAADSGQATPNPCYSGAWGVTIDFSVNIIIPTCTPPSVVSSTVVDDCANNRYFVSVEISSLGNGTPSISDETTTYPITAIGTIQVGPFVSGTSTSLTLLHGIETICDLPLGTFSSICPPANDECFTATPMVITGDFDSSAVVWNNTGGTNNPNNPLPTCEALNFAATGKDVWFQSNAPESGSVIVETRGNGGLTDTGFAVYTGDCDNLVLGACDADGGTGLFSLYSFTGLTPGQPLYIRLWGYNGASGSALVGCYDASLLNANVFDNKNFTYYPNPVKDVLNLSYTKNTSNVAVFNLLGQQIVAKVVNANQSKIDMSNLASGTYIVKVTSDNQIKTIKVIKE